MTTGSLSLTPRQGKGTFRLDTDTSNVAPTEERTSSERKQVVLRPDTERRETTVAPMANGRQTQLFDPPAASSALQLNGRHPRAEPTDTDLADGNFQARAVRQGRKAQEWPGLFWPRADSVTSRTGSR